MRILCSVVGKFDLLTIQDVTPEILRDAGRDILHPSRAFLHHFLTQFVHLHALPTDSQLTISDRLSNSLQSFLGRLIIFLEDFSEKGFHLVDRHVLEMMIESVQNVKDFRISEIVDVRCGWRDRRSNQSRTTFYDFLDRLDQS